MAKVSNGQRIARQSTVPWFPLIVRLVAMVKDGDETRWRIRFAYFDRHGQAQESADHVAQGSWKSGDSCVAVYRPDRPDLAALQSASAHSA